MSQYQAGMLAKKVMDVAANIGKLEVSLHNEEKRREGDERDLAYLEKEVAKTEAILQHQDACSTEQLARECAFLLQRARDRQAK